MLRGLTAILLCSSAGASLRGTRDLQVSVGGVSINIPGVGGSDPSSNTRDGNSGITIGGSGFVPNITIGGTGTGTSTSTGTGTGITIGGENGITIGNGTVSIGGQPIVSWGNGSTSNATCQNLPSTSLADEPSCVTALPTFYASTTDANFTQATRRARKEVLDAFCSTKCGQVFTARTVATRLHCTDRHRSNDTDITSGTISTSNISAGSGVSVVIPGIINVTIPGTNVSNRRQLAELDSALQPSFSPEFPGLYLGCIKDSTDNEYCAVKAADPDEKECSFYLSCCYAELNALTTIDLDKATYIESKCPGSTAYRLGTLCTA